MRIAASILPPINSQSQLHQRGNAQEVFAELVDDKLAVPLKPIVKIDAISAQAQPVRERFDLTSLRDQSSTSNEFPLSNQRALTTYQTVANNSLGIADNIVRLDIIV